MPSNNKTPLGLNQWLGADRPKREDFNQDNELIDLACRSTLGGLAEHLEQGPHPTEMQLSKWDHAARHPTEGIATPEGLHGLRYHEGQLEVNLGGLWHPCGGAAAPRYKVYGVCVDLSNSDPNASVTYTDDAVGMTPGGSAWDDTFLGSIRPCLLRYGVVTAYLDPGDYTRTATGEPADITSGAAGDLMVEIPKMAYSIHTEGGKLYVRVTNHPDARSVDERFCYLAHTRSREGDRERLYIGAYLGSDLGGRLASLSGKSPKVFTNMTTSREMARSCGDGYDLWSFYPYTLLQCLTLIRFGSRNLQGALGMGRSDGDLPVATTGFCDKKGLFFGESTGTQQMKCFGIEDFWGHCMTWLDGVRIDGNWHALTATANFHRQEAWQDRGRMEDVWMGIIDRVCGSNELGFLPTSDAAAPGTHWCDMGAADPECVCTVGGDGFGDKSGPFFMLFAYYDYITLEHLTGRLMYL